ncbi:MAG: hypothetical protein P8L31_04810 [Pseudomonadales bacterium]|nr:hypothetical protein [Pseudomonadales bacterium]
MKIKLYGERHTSTNYLTQLIRLNCAAELFEGVVPRAYRTLERLGISGLRDRFFRNSFDQNLGWKHAALPSLEKLAPHLTATRIVTLTKNPYAWIVSMHRRPYHLAGAAGLSIEEFVSRKWRMLERDNVAERALTITELWNRKNRTYLVPTEAAILNLTSETVQLDPSASVRQIAAFANLNCATNFQDFSASTKKRQNLDANYYRHYYAEEVWRETLSEQAISTINSELDQTLAAHFGYQKIEHSRPMDKSVD